MNTSRHRLVSEGYDRIADVYLERFGISTVRQQWFDRLILDLDPPARVLDLGCGAGIPV